MNPLRPIPPSRFEGDAELDIYPQKPYPFSPLYAPLRQSPIRSAPQPVRK